MHLQGKRTFTNFLQLHPWLYTSDYIFLELSFLSATNYNGMYSFVPNYKSL